MKSPTFNRCEQTLMIIGFFLNVLNLLFVITVSLYFAFKEPPTKSRTPASKHTTGDSITTK